MRRLALLALAIGGTAVLAACGTSSSSGLTGKNWQLTAITEKVPAFQGVIPAADQSRYVITFNTDDTLNATADCNQVAGSYKTSGSNGLTISPGQSTRAMCPEDSFGDLFVHGLGRAQSYAIANDVLTITLDDGGTMTFVLGAAASSGPTATGAPTASQAAPATAKPTALPTAKPTAPPTATPTKAPGVTAPPTPAPTPGPSAAAGLIGKQWQLTAITEKTPAFQGVVPPDQQANYTVQFVADKTFSAKADCNTLSGTYTTADPKAASGDLAIVPLTSTSSACPEGSLSDLYVVGLNNSASYTIANGQLTITLQDGGTLVYK